MHWPPEVLSAPHRHTTYGLRRFRKTAAVVRDYSIEASFGVNNSLGDPQLAWQRHIEQILSLMASPFVLMFASNQAVQTESMLDLRPNKTGHGISDCPARVSAMII